MNDSLIAAASVAALVLLVGVAEAAHRLLGVPGRMTRLSVHIAAGTLAALAPLLFRSALWPSAAAGVAVAVNFLAYRRGMFRSLHVARPRSAGTVWFPASALLLYLMAWDRPALITIPLLVMAFADAAGVVVGEGLKAPRRLPGRLAEKTWDGSVAVFAVTGLAVSLGWEAFRLGPTGSALLVGLACAPIAAVVEATSRKGLDNLTLPLAVAFTLLIPLSAPAEAPWGLLSAEALAAVTVVAAVRWRSLSPGGAAGAFLLAAWLLGGGGWAWTLPVLVFFILSSALSRMWTARRAEAMRRAEKGSRRDLAQVMANGGVPLAIFAGWMVTGGTDLLWPAFIGAVAAAAADTWGTEIGTAFRAEARLVTTWRVVPAGTSGGISLPGTAASAAGAMVIGLAALVVPVADAPGGWVAAVCGTVGGLAGALVDSLLGATLQAHWCDAGGRITERRPRGAGAVRAPVRGVAWIDNDVVNALAAAVGAGVAALLASVFAA